MTKPAPGTVLNGQVRLIQPLADGGMGSVWIAHHLGLDARVAVKFLSAELVKKDPSLNQRLQREARIAAQIRSVHAVKTFDHGITEDGLAYLVMELLEGIDLGRVVSLSGPLDLPQTAVIVAQVAKVLDRAHEIGVVHRDIKPGNIFLVDSEYDVFVKLLDFGIATKGSTGGDSVVTREGTIFGTIEFMSPEQLAAAKDVDFRSDLYSLGACAYYALTSKLPFEVSEAAPLRAQQEAGPPPIQRWRPDLPAALDGWFRQALAADPAARFGSAEAMSAALDAILHGRHEPVSDAPTEVVPDSRGFDLPPGSEEDS